MPTIGVSTFCQNRHGLTGDYTRYLRVGEDGNVDWGFLIALTSAYWDDRTPGYRDGVVVVPVPGIIQDGTVSGVGEEPIFTCPVVVLSEGDELVGRYWPRRPGEAPRKMVFVRGRGHEPAKWASIVLYRQDVLLESGDDTTGEDWDIVTLLGSQERGEEPMPPGTLMANQFGADGGTDTRMTPEEFEAALRRSFDYWKDKAIAAGD